MGQVHVSDRIQGVAWEWGAGQEEVVIREGEATDRWLGHVDVELLEAERAVVASGWWLGARS